MIEKTLLLEVLERWNLWEKKMEAGIRRTSYIDKIMPYMKRKEVIALKGIRRSGKSTLVRQLMMELIRKGADKRQILFLNLEDYSLADHLDVELLEQAFQTYKEHTNNRKRTYFFIDEVQNIHGWERWVRTRYDLNEDLKIIITGSAASMISRELSTLLTGRNISFSIMPLSFKEYQDFSKKPSLKEYLRFGGFPEVVLETDAEKKITLLQQYFEDIIYKDIVNRYKIRNPKQLMAIARYFMDSSCSKVSVNKLSKVFGLSNDTISMYISHMIDAFLLFEVTFFSHSAKIRHDVTKLPKLYVLDNGFITAIGLKENLGQMFENAVLIRLAEQYQDISYWSELKSEVDFIVENKAINATSSDKIHPRELDGLDRFQKLHSRMSKILITKSRSGQGMISLRNFLLN
ncbi:MAG: ATP-binding protein [Nanoarchaeota archaeon]|nr:ATP-binding protein [Nanoarchaeota archaeon]